MSTRVIQLDIFQAGFRDDSDVVLNGGSVEFYTADQTYTTPKNAYTTKDKGSTITSVTLDPNGAYPTGLYFDGATVYDFRLKDSDGATVRNYTNVKIPQSTSNIRTVTGTTTATVDDDAILCDGTFTVNLYPVADFVSPVVIKNIGSGTITVDADGSELIDGATTATITAGVARQYWSDGTQWYAAATVTGTDFTDTNLIAGTNITFDSSGGVTTVNVPDASNTTKGAIEIATDAEATTGTAESLAVNPKQLKAATDAIPLATVYSSTGQTITTSGRLVLPHGLATEPKLIQYILECTTAEFNYSIGDRIMVGVTSDNTLNNPTIDATNITVGFSNNASCFRIGDKADGTLRAATNANWQLYVNAWT